jgi:hypothetical protein
MMNKPYGFEREGEAPDLHEATSTTARSSSEPLAVKQITWQLKGRHPARRAVKLIHRSRGQACR